MATENFRTKPEVIAEYRRSETDSGSPEVQIALLTKRLEYLSTHFKSHPKDKHSARGLSAIVSRRKRLLDYLRRKDVNRYRTVISSLGLRK